MIQKIKKINISPEAEELWQGIGGHFDSFSQVIAEFIDNSISNILNNDRNINTIIIDINETEDNMINVKIEDAGTGIKDIAASFKLGDKSVGETPLNEHGFGLKHALATANPSNNSWVIYTRTKEDVNKGIYKKITAPYDFNLQYYEIDIKEEQWPGQFNTDGGTIIEFKCSKTFFNTIQKGIRGRASFNQCLNYLQEELGYIYSGLIEKGKISLKISSKSLNNTLTVSAVTPYWIGYYPPKTGTKNIDLGNGEVTIHYTFGEVKDNNQYKKYYKRNLSTSGVEIRVNGRLLASNLFKEIWNLENHPLYNHLLVIIDLETEDLNKLPKTRTSKNGIRSGDEKLEKLYKWIREVMPTPPKKLTSSVTESELISELAKLKETHIPATDKIIKKNFEVFAQAGTPVQVDLYIFDGNKVVIYEAKKGIAGPQSVYQLLMYWDGLVFDGIEPSEGILLAEDFSDAVKNLIGYFNQRRDQNGNHYNFVLKKWEDEGIRIQ